MSKTTEENIIWFIELWFETHRVLTKDHFEMLKQMITYMETQK